MADPHRPDRYGELWNQSHIDCCEVELRAIRDLVTVSGGWAWHFMSAPGHAELKHAHDHKDLDLFAAPGDVAELSARLQAQGYVRSVTRFDKKPAPYPFRRMVRDVDLGPQGVHTVILDLFTGEVPSRILPSGWRVVDPAHLLTLYKTVHGTDTCFAVKAAARLLRTGIDPVGHPDLASPPRQGQKR